MTMLRTLFEKPTDGKDTSHYFKNLKIWQQYEKYRAEQGKKPVIYITSRGINELTFNAAYDEAVKCVLVEYKRHRELENSKKLHKDDKDFYKKLAKGKAPYKDWSTSAAELSRMLCILPSPIISKRLTTDI